MNSPTSDGWIEEATKHFRVILPDQRGTGRSSRVDTHVMARIAAAHDDDAAAGARAQADYLKKFLADSIVRDFEHLRLTEFGGRKWVTMGQSYGGFLTLTTLSLFPAGVIASFTTGGIPHVPADAAEVYEHTFPRMVRKTTQSTSATHRTRSAWLPSPTSCRLLRKSPNSLANSPIQY